MARLYGFMFLVAFLVIVAGIVWAVVRSGSRYERKIAAQDRRRDELLDKLHGHSLTDVDTAREDLARHRRRLEQSLDDLHDPNRSQRYGGVDEE